MSAGPAFFRRFGRAPHEGPVCLESVASADHLISNTRAVPAFAGPAFSQMRLRAGSLRKRIVPMAIGAAHSRGRRERIMR